MLWPFLHIIGTTSQNFKDLGQCLRGSPEIAIFWTSGRIYTFAHVSGIETYGSNQVLSYYSMSQVMSVMSHVMYVMSHVMYVLSHVMYIMSHVMYVMYVM